MDQENKITTDQQAKNIDQLSDFLVFFKDNADFVFVYKKTEKLVTAIYMITNLFSDNEPMKWTLRKNVSDLLSAILGYKDIFQTQQANFLNDIRSKVLELVSLLEIASLSGLVSAMNFSILKQEFSNLINTLETSHGLNKDMHRESFSKMFFDVPKLKNPHDSGAGQNLENRASHGGHSYEIRDKNSQDERQSDRHVEKRSNRQNIILNLLKKKGDLTIKDISEVIKDCSEKTIQRELISFMALGIVKRVGERRWSRYSLV